MRTTEEIAAFATQMEGNRWKIRVDPKLTYADADQHPLFRRIRISPVYLDETVADDRILEATLWHEMGHFYDPALRLLMLAILLLAFSIIFSASHHWFLLIPLLVVLLVAVLASRSVCAPWFEARADAWAAKRMKDYFLHKNRL